MFGSDPVSDNGNFLSVTPKVAYRGAADEIVTASRTRIFREGLIIHAYFAHLACLRITYWTVLTHFFYTFFSYVMRLFYLLSIRVSYPKCPGRSAQRFWFPSLPKLRFESDALSSASRCGRTISNPPRQNPNPIA